MGLTEKGAGWLVGGQCAQVAPPCAWLALTQDTPHCPSQAPDCPLNEQVDNRGHAALAPNRLADATFRALDELVQVAPVTHVPSEGLDGMHRV